VETKAPRSTAGGPDVSRRPKTASADRHATRKLRSLLPHGLEIRTWAFSSHGADAIEPLTPLSQNLGFPSGLAFARFVGETEDRQDHRCHRLVKADAS
jgi:hypothetical protein